MAKYKTGDIANGGGIQVKEHRLFDTEEDAKDKSVIGRFV